MSKLHWLRFSLITVTILAVATWEPIKTIASTPTDTLIDHAKKLSDAALPKWARPIPQSYTWLSNDSIFYMQDFLNPTAVQKNLTTGAEMPLDNLTEFFNARGGRINSIDMSPDKKHFLWQASSLKDGHFYCSNLIAEHPVRWNVNSDTGNRWLWMPDSRHWVEFVQNTRTNRFTQLLIHSLRPQEPPKRVSLLPTSPVSRKNIGSFYWCIIPDGTLLTQGDYTTKTAPSTIQINAVDLMAQGALRHQYQLAFPADVEDFQPIIFSPQGDKAACQMWIKRGPVRRLELWVWRLGNVQGRSLGAIYNTDGGTKDGQSYVMPLDDLQWRPDGKQLSFIYRDALYSVPAEF